MKPTDTSNPDYFHKVVDCQRGCPAHTDVPAYIRMIAQGEFSDAYMENRKSNVFPGILGRVCDRPCEPACRRGRHLQEVLRPPRASLRRRGVPGQGSGARDGIAAQERERVTQRGDDDLVTRLDLGRAEHVEEDRLPGLRIERSEALEVVGTAAIQEPLQ